MLPTVSPAVHHARVLAQSVNVLWEWLWVAFEAFQRWISGKAGPDFWASAAVFLIVGGISVLSLVVLLVLLRAIFPYGEPDMPTARAPKVSRKLVPLPAGAYVSLPFGNGHSLEVQAAADDGQMARKGRRAAANIPARGLDDLLDPLIQKGSAQLRVLRHEAQYSLVRFYRCRGCRENEDQESKALSYWSYACAFHRGYLEEGFRKLTGLEAQVRETSCHQHGQPVCDFEVTLR